MTPDRLAPVPKATDQTVPRPNVDSDPKKINQQLSRIVEFLSNESSLRTGERIYGLKPEVRVGLAKAVRILELTVLPVATRKAAPDVVPTSEALPSAPAAQVAGEPVGPESTAALAEADAEPIGAPMTLKRLIGDYDDLGLTAVHADDIAELLLEIHGPINKDVRLPWKTILQLRFSGVPVEEIAQQVGVNGGPALSVVISNFLSPIKQKYPKDELKELFKIRLGIIPSSAPTAPPKASSVPATPAKEKHIKTPEVITTDTVGTFTQALRLSVEEREALEQFLAREKSAKGDKRPHAEVVDTVNKLRHAVKDHFATLSHPAFGFQQAERAALYKTLGWYSQGDNITFRDPSYVRNFIIRYGRVDLDLVDASESAYAKLATALLQVVDESAEAEATK